VVILLALYAAVPATAGDDTANAVKLTGYFTDEWCGKSNANAEGAECARRCAAKGSAMALYAAGRLYVVRAADKQRAVDNVGVEVVVVGKLSEDGHLEIASIKKAAPKD